MKIVKKPEGSPLAEFAIQLLAVLAALVAAGLVMAAMGYNPLEVYKNMVVGALGSSYRIKATLNKAIPLTILSLGVSVAFQMKFWNIGAEGQMAMGGMFCTYVALNFQSLPRPLLLALMLAAGVAGGALWALIPALLKVKLGTNETLVTLMLNYVALKWITYLQYGPWKAPGGFPKIPDFTQNAQLPSLFGVHIGWVFALLCVFFVYLLMRRSKLGYEISVIGESQSTARYAGINVLRVTVFTLLLSGGLCGLAGMIQTSAVEKTLVEAFTAGLGFTAAITAWLAKLNPLAIVVTSFSFAVMIAGSSFLQTAMRIPSSMAEVIQGVIILFVLGCEFFTQYKLVAGHKKEGSA